MISILTAIFSDFPLLTILLETRPANICGGGVGDDLENLLGFVLYLLLLFGMLYAISKLLIPEDLPIFGEIASENGPGNSERVTMSSMLRALVVFFLLVYSFEIFLLQLVGIDYGCITPSFPPSVDWSLGMILLGL